VILVVFVGCVSPAAQFAERATALGLRRAVVTEAGLPHVLYSKTGTPTATLHVYLDGDGTPWIGRQPAADPTPRNPLMLRLMALDPAPAVYVGRPCYHGTAAIAPCSARLWTNDRYSAEVVGSLSTVVRQFMTHEGYEGIAWFGHSGGGTIAVLLAGRFPETRTLVTIAANLDTAAWAAYAGHADLSGSLNPASAPPLSPQIQQWHYAGGKDCIVPPTLTAPVASRLGAPLRVIDNYDHVCCWEQIWSRILNELSGDGIALNPGKETTVIRPQTRRVMSFPP
jgi:pimeloyl-ACP methyl ester carboxylesterase